MNKQPYHGFGWVAAFWGCALLWVITVFVDITSGFAAVNEIIFHSCILVGWLTVSIIQTVNFVKQFKEHSGKEEKNSGSPST